MFDREKIEKLTREALSPFGPLQTLPSNSDTKIKIFEYADAEGDIILGKHIALHYRPGHYLGFCRSETFERKCLFCEANNTRKRSVCSKLIYRQAVNVIDVEHFRPAVYRLMLPLSVFSNLVACILYSNGLDTSQITTDRVLVISSRGKGMDTRYRVEITDQIYPVGDDLLGQVIDPTLEIPDRGLDYQREVLNGLESESGKG